MPGMCAAGITFLSVSLISNSSEVMTPLANKSGVKQRFIFQLLHTVAGVWSLCAPCHWVAMSEQIKSSISICTIFPLTILDAANFSQKVTERMRNHR